MRDLVRTARAGIVCMAAAVLVAGLTGCASKASSDSSSASSSGNKASGEIDGKGRQLVLFTFNEQGGPYVTAFNNAAKAEADRLGFKLKVIESPLDPSVQASQIQQYLASGQKPAGFLRWPLDSKAGIVQNRQLSQVAPVVQLNSFPVSDEEREYIKAFCCQTDVAIAQNAAAMLTEVRDRLKSQGVKFHSDKGNLVLMGAAAGYTGSDIRLASLIEALKAKPFNVLATLNSPDSGTQGAFTVMSQQLPTLKRDGVDFIFSNNDAEAVGIIKALRQAGLEPGKDVWIVSGDCSPGVGSANEEAGAVEGVSIASPQIEGPLSIEQ